MTKPRTWRMAWAIFLLLAATAIAVPAQVFDTLANFDATDGAQPLYMSLVQGQDRNLYGTTVGGGSFDVGFGTVFAVTPGGQLMTVYSFCAQPSCADGDQPNAGLVLGVDGKFYGTTLGGGVNNDGTIFRITAQGTLTTLHSFDGNDGSLPFAALIQGSDGNFYGTTYQGGNLACDAPLGCGTVFKITPGGVLTTLLSFNSTDGANPRAALVQASDGNFYGTTSHSGPIAYYRAPYSGGTVFKITPAGELTTLHGFCIRVGCADGDNPTAALIQGRDGNFYGTTLGGGTNYFCIAQGCGTVFRITAKGGLITLYNFCSQTRNCLDGSNPLAGLVQGTDGAFYGTTYYSGVNGDGTVFRIDPSGTLVTLHSFDSTDGAAPSGGLAQATNGTFYGTTSIGGADGSGTVFSLSIGLTQFVAFVRDSGKVGQTGGILGQGFTGTTGVLFNGTAARFTVESDTFLSATVPAGATSGYVTVTTPTGILTSNVPFCVIP